MWGYWDILVEILWCVLFFLFEVYREGRLIGKCFKYKEVCLSLRCFLKFVVLGVGWIVVDGKGGIGEYIYGENGVGR